MSESDMGTQSDDRRQHPRHPLVLPWPAKGDFNGQIVEADIIDISRMGAKFRVKDPSVQTNFTPGNKTNWTVKLPSGSEVVTETLSRWIHRFPEGYILGANFTNQVNNQIVDELQRLKHPESPE